MPDRIPCQMGPEFGIPEHGAVECETRHGNMKSLELVGFPTCMPPHNLVLFTYGAFQHDGATAVRDHRNRPCAEPPDLAEAVEEVQGVDALLVGEVLRPPPSPRSPATSSARSSGYRRPPAPRSPASTTTRAVQAGGWGATSMPQESRSSAGPAPAYQNANFDRLHVAGAPSLRAALPGNQEEGHRGIAGPRVEGG